MGNQECCYASVILGRETLISCLQSAVMSSSYGTGCRSLLVHCIGSKFEVILINKNGLDEMQFPYARAATPHAIAPG
jgi:hypothetical protein